MYECYARIDLSKTLYSPSIVDLRLLKKETEKELIVEM